MLVIFIYFFFFLSLSTKIRFFLRRGDCKVIMMSQKTIGGMETCDFDSVPKKNTYGRQTCLVHDESDLPIYVI